MRTHSHLPLHTESATFIDCTDIRINVFFSLTNSTRSAKCPIRVWSQVKLGPKLQYTRRHAPPLRMPGEIVEVHIHRHRQYELQRRKQQIQNGVRMVLLLALEVTTPASQLAPLACCPPQMVAKERSSPSIVLHMIRQPLLAFTRRG